MRLPDPEVLTRLIRQPPLLLSQITPYWPHNDQTTDCWNKFKDYETERAKNDVCTDNMVCCDRIWYILEHILQVEDARDCDVNTTLLQHQEQAVRDRVTQCGQFKNRYCSIFYSMAKHCSCTDSCNDT